MDGFTLTVNGTNFLGTSVVHWNGAERTTTFVNASRLTAAIPASDIVSPASPPVTVLNLAPGGGTSAATRSPSAHRESCADDHLTRPDEHAGRGGRVHAHRQRDEFRRDLRVRWNGAARTTTFVNAGQVTAAIPASDIGTRGARR